MSKTRRIRCRCRHCHSRRTLARHPDLYIRQPSCAMCGYRRWAVDSYRQSGREAAASTCYCDGFPHPHRRGSHSGAYICHAAHPAEFLAQDLASTGLLTASSTGSAEPPF